MATPFHRPKISTNTSAASVALASAANAAADFGSAINKKARRISCILSSTTTPATSTTSTTPTIPARTCDMCKLSILRPIWHMSCTFTGEQPRYFHLNCFVCLHCNAQIEPKSQLYYCVKFFLGEKWTAAIPTNREHGAFKDVNTNDEKVHPFHQECFAHHFGYICVVCEKPLIIETTQTNDTHPHVDDDNAGAKQNIGGRTTLMVKCTQHVFFNTERMCPHHTLSPAMTTITSSRKQRQERFQPSRQENYDGALIRSMGVDSHAPPRGRVEIDGGNGSRGNIIGIASCIDIITTPTTTTDEQRNAPIRRCEGCHRFEPISPAKHFVDVGDSNTGRCVCWACEKTMVVTYDDIVPLWHKVIDFFEGPLGVITSEDSGYNNIGTVGRGCGSGNGGVTRQDLAKIPILVVGMEALNDNIRSTIFCPSRRIGRGHAYSDSGIGVTAILCLSGLPSDLTAINLAHEAFRAWIKLHPNFSNTSPLPLRVEEGLAQLAAFLFLSDGLDPIDKKPPSRHHNAGKTPRVDVIYKRGGAQEEVVDDARYTAEEDEYGIPWEAKLRQYFKFRIETDDSVCGQVFRAAARAHAKLGMEELLYYVALNKDFPPAC